MTKDDGSLGNVRQFWRGARRRKPRWSGTDWYMPAAKRKSPWGLVLTILIGLAAGAAVATGSLVALPYLQ